jgi:formylglycine-generating enzyme required for sulfatase activity
MGYQTSGSGSTIVSSVLKSWKKAVCLALAAACAVLAVTCGLIRWRILSSRTSAPDPLGRLLARGFVLPSGTTDQYGNPVVTRCGQRTDPSSGYPFEVWKVYPRVEFVLVPSGQFMMGTPDRDPVKKGIIGLGTWRTDESPSHLVAISSPFYMSKYEITRSQWFAVMGGHDTSVVVRTDSLPTQGVSFAQCSEFCRRTGLMLPTEAQWEFACRAGTTTRFCAGDDFSSLGSVAWFALNSLGTAHAVGQKLPNAWGLYDMHGNVAEICIDTYCEDFYSRRESSFPDPILMGNTGLRKLARGGSYVGYEDCTSGSRGIAGIMYDGFRPVLILRE